MEMGDWVVVKTKVNEEGEPIRGYIEKFYYDDINDYAVIIPMNENKRDMSFNVNEIELDEDKHPDDVKVLIELALMTRDKDYFDELINRQAVEYP